MDELEPQFVDTITGIYEHIFDVDLHSYREVLCYLISATMRKTEDNRSFLVHVSKEDYPYVSMQKKQIMAGATAPNSTVEAKCHPVSHPIKTSTFLFNIFQKLLHISGQIKRTLM